MIENKSRINLEWRDAGLSEDTCMPHYDEFITFIGIKCEVHKKSSIILL
jgi:hypothetical protein